LFESSGFQLAFFEICVLILTASMTASLLPSTMALS
jgi:hypothetical protein